MWARPHGWTGVAKFGNSLVKLLLVRTETIDPCQSALSAMYDLRTSSLTLAQRVCGAEKREVGVAR